MAKRITSTLAAAAEFFARLWPMSKTEQRVLRDYEATHPGSQPVVTKPEPAEVRRGVPG